MYYTLVWKSTIEAIYLGAYDSADKANEVVGKSIARRMLSGEIDLSDLNNALCEYQLIVSELDSLEIIGIID